MVQPVILYGTSEICRPRFEVCRLLPLPPIPSQDNTRSTSSPFQPTIPLLPMTFRTIRLRLAGPPRELSSTSSPPTAERIGSTTSRRRSPGLARLRPHPCPNLV